MNKGLLEFNTKVVWSDRIIQNAVQNVAIDLNKTINLSNNFDNLVYVCVMTGAVQFFSDITRKLPSGYCQYMTASSYHSNERTDDIVIQIPTIGEDYVGDVKEIFIFDDICDTGNTLNHVVKGYQNKYPNANTHTVVLIHRQRSDSIYRPNFSAIKTHSDEWYGGYGLDNKGMDRNLPYIYGIPKGYE